LTLFLPYFTILFSPIKGFSAMAEVLGSSPGPPDPKVKGADDQSKKKKNKLDQLEAELQEW